MYITTNSRVLKIDPRPPDAEWQHARKWQFRKPAVMPPALHARSVLAARTHIRGLTRQQTTRPITRDAPNASVTKNMNVPREATGLSIVAQPMHVGRQK